MLKSRYAGLLLCALAGAHCGAHAAYVVPAGTMTEIQSNFSSLYSARNDGADRLTLTTQNPAGGTRPTTLIKLYSTDASHHSDFSLNGEQAPIGTRARWYAMSFFLPSDWSYTATPITVAQLDLKDNPTNLAPPLALQVRGDKLVLNLHANHLASGATDANSAQETFTVGPATLGQWHCMVVRAVWSATPGAGSLSVSLDRAVKPVYSGKLSYNSYLGSTHVPRVGLSVGAGANVGIRTLYADYIWAGDEPTPIAEISGKTPCPAP